MGLVLLSWRGTGVLALAVPGGRVVPVTEASPALLPPWGLVLAGLVLLLVYVAANRARPDFDVVLVPGGGPPPRGAV